MKTSAYEEKLKLVTEFVKLNSPSEMFNIEYKHLNVLPICRQEQYTLFDQVWHWLFLNDILISEHKEIYDRFEKDNVLCQRFLNYVLSHEFLTPNKI